MATTTTATKRETKVQKIDRLLALTQVKADSTLVEFLTHEKELLSKKNSSERKPTKTQVENESIKDSIYEGMEDNRDYTVTEVIKSVPECNELTCQKVSALLRQMEKVNLVKSHSDKRKTLYCKVQ